MTLSSHSSPYGYKNLLVYRKAEELQRECALLTSHFPHSKILYSLADQMDRSARSVKQNIVEGWKRNSTKEYHQFLGFSLGANAELEEDCNDIIKGVYKKVGLKGERGERGAHSAPWTLDEVERLPFYPLSSRLPPVVQLKLRCKELNFLLQKLQGSLVEKMQTDHSLPLGEMQSQARAREASNDAWLKKERQKWEEEKGDKREKREKGV